MIIKLRKAFWMLLIRLVGKFRPAWGSSLSIRFYRSMGMKFEGNPTFVAGDAWFDGTDAYSLITLSEGVNISQDVQVLTHDWSPYCVLRALGRDERSSVGRKQPVHIGPHAFIGLGSILMPGTTIGRGSIVGAGSVVRGVIPDFSLVIGNPAEVVGDSRDYVRSKFPDEWAATLDESKQIDATSDD